MLPPATLRGTFADRRHRRRDAARARLRLLRSRDGLSVLPLVREAELAPAAPGWRRRLERARQVRRWGHRAVLGVELEGDPHRLAALEARGFAVRAPQR